MVSGLIKQGSIKINDVLQLGPDKSGAFINVAVKSLHLARVNTTSCEAGMFCTA